MLNLMEAMTRPYHKVTGFLQNVKEEVAALNKTIWTHMKTWASILSDQLAKLLNLVKECPHYFRQLADAAKTLFSGLVSSLVFGWTVFKNRRYPTQTNNDIPASPRSPFVPSCCQTNRASDLQSLAVPLTTPPTPPHKSGTTEASRECQDISIPCDDLRTTGCSLRLRYSDGCERE